MHKHDPQQRQHVVPNRPRNEQMSKRIRARRFLSPLGQRGELRCDDDYSQQAAGVYYPADAQRRFDSWICDKFANSNSVSFFLLKLLSRTNHRQTDHSFPPIGLFRRRSSPVYLRYLLYQRTSDTAYLRSRSQTDFIASARSVGASRAAA